MSAIGDQAEVERSVREMLYGERAEVRAVPCDSVSVGRLAGDRYRLLEEIGSGGTGTISRARDERLKREVAVKLIDERLARNPGSVEDFRLEAERGARLGHTNIVGVLDSGTSPRDFIVMELVDGLDVAELLRREEPLAAGEVLHLIVQICDALTHAHTRGVVHGDVTPRNILVELPHLTAKLAHFGVASDKRPNAAAPCGYVAPEVVQGAPPSPLSDLYSLGRVAYGLLARPPADDPETVATLRPSLPRRLCEAVEQACAGEARERQESVAEFRAQLTRPWDAAIIPFQAAA